MFQTFLLVATIVVATTTAQLCFKKAILKMGALDFSLANAFSLVGRIVQNVWIISGVVLFGIGFLLWLFVISRLQINIAYPITIALQTILITVGSWLFFKEYLSLYQIIGIAIVILGIFFILNFKS